MLTWSLILHWLRHILTQILLEKSPYVVIRTLKCNGTIDTELKVISSSNCATKARFGRQRAFSYFVARAIGQLGKTCKSFKTIRSQRNLLTLGCCRCRRLPIFPTGTSSFGGDSAIVGERNLPLLKAGRAWNLHMGSFNSIHCPKIILNEFWIDRQRKAPFAEMAKMHLSKIPLDFHAD